MRLLLGTLTLALAVLLSGCSGDPRDVARTDAPAPTDATASGTPPPEGVLDFGGSSGATVPRCRPPRTYLAVGQVVEVLHEAALDAPTVVGGGRLVGDAFIAPGRAGRNNGTTSIGDRPRFGVLTELPAWDRREVLDGQVVAPGTYVVMLLLEARPGSDVDGVAFPWRAGSAEGSDLLGTSLRYARRCRG